MSDMQPYWAVGVLWLMLEICVEHILAHGMKMTGKQKPHLPDCFGHMNPH